MSSACVRWCGWLASRIHGNWRIPWRKFRFRGFADRFAFTVAERVARSVRHPAGRAIIHAVHDSGADAVRNAFTVAFRDALAVADKDAHTHAIGHTDAATFSDIHGHIHAIGHTDGATFSDIDTHTHADATTFSDIDSYTGAIVDSNWEAGAGARHNGGFRRYARNASGSGHDFEFRAALVDGVPAYTGEPRGGAASVTADEI